MGSGELRVVFGELTNPAGVILDGLWVKACELDITEVILIPLAGSEGVILSVFLTWD